jgi:hypothetical protein
MIMKKVNIILIAGILLLSLSCKKAIDCTAEMLFSFITHTKNPDDHKIVTFEFDYSGEFTVSSIVWDFGDGTSVTDYGTQVTHTYAATGAYTVKATITLGDPKKDSCSQTKELNFTV